MDSSARDLSDDTPLRLDVAVKAAFPAGGITVAGLRKEIAKGRLEVELIAGKLFTTLGAISRMRERCRVVPKNLDAGVQDELRSRPIHDEGRIAQAQLHAILTRQTKRPKVSGQDRKSRKPRVRRLAKDREQSEN